MSDYARTGQILAMNRPVWRTRSKRSPGQANRGSSRQGKASASPACPGMLSLPGATLRGRTLYDLLMHQQQSYDAQAGFVCKRSLLPPGPARSFR
ncbi:hypothetical protein C8Q73DRAFT_223694 [Cubamyces lactineus]|nr:hypothetical protein C8Q73DRAFT_223694 [Cubamyces lactineus]